MLQVRRRAERGYFDHGWLKSYHTFSFADYHDPDWIAYGPLRVINDDRVAPGQGFGKHGHRDMEILTYILEGELEHQDSMGNGSIIRVGDVQRMSACTGVTHSEFNPPDKEEGHPPDREEGPRLHIVSPPEGTRRAPGYEHKHFAAADKRGRLRLIASRAAEDGAVVIHHDARVYAGLFDGAEHAHLPVSAGRRAWVQVARGRLAGDGARLEAGDGAHTAGPAHLALRDGAQ